jgi:hypothetical protein
MGPHLIIYGGYFSPTLAFVNVHFSWPFLGGAPFVTNRIKYLERN